MKTCKSFLTRAINFAGFLALGVLAWTAGAGAVILLSALGGRPRG